MPFSQCSLATSGRCAVHFIIALGLDIHVFEMHPEAKGTILHIRNALRIF